MEKIINVSMTLKQVNTVRSVLRLVGRSQAKALQDPFRNPSDILEASEALAEAIELFNAIETEE